MVGDIVTNYIFDAGYTFGAHCNYWFAIEKLFPVQNVLINFNLKFSKYVDLDFSENIFQIASTEQPLGTRFFPVLYLFGAKSVWGNLKKGYLMTRQQFIRPFMTSWGHLNIWNLFKI